MPAAVQKRIMVIGAGAAGMECAIAATRRGHKVTVFERRDAVGGSLIGYAAHDLAHKEDLASVVAHYRVMAKKLGIDVRLNAAVDAKLMRGLLHQFDVAVVATGTRVDMTALPAPANSSILVDAFDVALGKVQPGRKVVVVGGGKIGLTLAESLKTQGCDIVIVERDKRIVGDVMPTWKWRHTAWIDELEIQTYTDSRVTHIGADHVIIADSMERNCTSRPTW